jgi:hypothetical protein
MATEKAQQPTPLPGTPLRHHPSNTATLHKAMRALTGTSTTIDCLILAVLILISALFYLPRLGFYADDWGFLSAFHFTPHQSILGLFSTNYTGDIRMRPFQLLYMLLLYRAFGVHPLGYAIVNTAVFATGICLLYVALRSLKLPRPLALLIVTIYFSLANYSTDRFWYSAVQANLSAALYFLSLYADLRFVQSRSVYRWLFRILSCIAIVGSILSYETFLPLFLFNLGLLAFVWLRRYGTSSSFHNARLVVMLSTNFAIIMGCVAFKAVTSVRTSLPVGLHGYAKASEMLVFHSLVLNYGRDGILLPRTVRLCLTKYPDWSAIFASFVVGLSTYFLLKRALSSHDISLDRRRSLLLVLLGLCISTFCYTVFLSLAPQYSVAGVANRTDDAAALGVAVAAVGVIYWLSSFVTGRTGQTRVVCVMASMLCAAGVLITNTTSTFWGRGSAEQERISRSVGSILSKAPSGSTIVLKGGCPYIGPGIVFESKWDVSGKLRLLTGDSRWSGDIVTDRMAVSDDSLVVSVYGERYTWPYDALYLYDVRTGQLEHVTDAVVAHEFLDARSGFASTNCRWGWEGEGVPVFGLGPNGVAWLARQSF